MRRQPFHSAKPGDLSSLLSSQRVARGLFTLAVLCQVATVAITWSVWNVREQPPNIPWLPLPALPFAWAMVASLLVAACWPRGGVVLHAVIYGLACVWDQYRLQPQVISLIVLMAACAFDMGGWFARWYLAVMWLWSGLHKFLSEEWFGIESWRYLESSGLPADDWHVAFAIFVAAAEVGLGLLAIFWPRRAAMGCALFHVAILFSLSPLFRDFNASVWPWNLATAAIGPWVLLRQERFSFSWTPASSWTRTAIVAGLFIIPAGYYFDLVNAHLAFVLYSGNMPRALHVRQDGVRRLDGWGGLAVPFPDAPRMFRQVFLQTAAVGDKLHVAEPRIGLPDRYFLKEAGGIVTEISSARFFADERPGGEAAGIGLDWPAAIWRLRRDGATVDPSVEGFIQTVTLRGPDCTDRSIAILRELPNLRELRLEDAAVSDAGLRHADALERLEILEVVRCGITNRGLSDLRRLSHLTWLHLEGTQITGDGLSALDELKALQVLVLPGLPMDEQGLQYIGAQRQLRWLDLRDSPLASADLVHLHGLTECAWLDLSGTPIDDDALQSLAGLASLQRLIVTQTRVTDAGVARLQSALPDCKIER